MDWSFQARGSVIGMGAGMQITLWEEEHGGMKKKMLVELKLREQSARESWDLGEAMLGRTFGAGLRIRVFSHEQ